MTPIPTARISSEDLLTLRSFQPGIEWGIINSTPDLAISSPLSLSDARRLARRIREHLTPMNHELFVEQVSAFKGVSPNPQLSAPHYVVVPKSHIQQLICHTTPSPVSNLDFFAAIANCSQSTRPPAVAKTTYDHEEHPIIQLNRRVKSCETVQRSLKKKFDLAQKGLDTSRHTGKSSLYTQGNVEIADGIVEGFPYGLAASTGYSTRNHVKTEKRNNEDSLKVFTLTLKIGNIDHTIPFFGVFDGHGSVEGTGKEQSNYIAENIRHVLQVELTKAFSATTERDLLTVEAILFNSLKTSFANISADAHRKFYRYTSGSTATLSFIFNNCIWTACAGDSRAIFTYKHHMGDAEAVGLSTDRKPISHHQKPNTKKSLALDAEEQDQTIYNRGSGIHFLDGTLRTFSKLAILKALGHDEIEEGINPRPDITKLPFRYDCEGRQFLIIASDGLWDFVSPKEAANILHAPDCQTVSCKDMAERFTRMAYHRGSKDDISVMVVEINPPQKATISIDPSSPFYEIQRTYSKYHWIQNGDQLEAIVPKSECLGLRGAIWTQTPRFDVRLEKLDPFYYKAIVTLI